MDPATYPRKTLHIRNFVVLDMVQRETIAGILQHSIVDIASRNRCNLVHIHLPLKSYWAAQRFEKKGYQVDFCNFACEKLSRFSG
jgi:hypothetical protein